MLVQITDNPITLINKVNGLIITFLLLDLEFLLTSPTVLEDIYKRDLSSCLLNFIWKRLQDKICLIYTQTVKPTGLARREFRQSQRSHLRTLKNFVSEKSENVVKNRGNIVKNRVNIG